MIKEILNQTNEAKSAEKKAEKISKGLDSTIDALIAKGDYKALDALAKDLDKILKGL